MIAMRKAGQSAIIALGLVLAASCKPAAEAKPKPALELTGRVVDRADLLDPETESQITARLEELEADTKVQFVVVTTPSLGGKEIKAYSMALAKAWGIGDAKRNDGLVLLVAPNERKARIEVGLGLESTLPNPLCAKIMGEMIPRFSHGQLRDGIVLGEQRIEGELRARIPGGVT